MSDGRACQEPDYTIEGVDERESPRLADRIIRWMVDYTVRVGNFRESWEWSADHGVWEIATFSAEGFPEERIADLRDDPGYGLEARGYIGAVSVALDRLVADGLIEIEFAFGKPAYRTTMKAVTSIESRFPAQQFAMVGRIAELRSMPYPEYLKTREWDYRRTIHVDAAGGRCQVCNAPGRLHIHHRSYANRGWERFGDLIALCPPCHQVFHVSGRIVAR